MNLRKHKRYAKKRQKIIDILSTIEVSRYDMLKDEEIAIRLDIYSAKPYAERILSAFGLNKPNKRASKFSY